MKPFFFVVLGLIGTPVAAQPLPSDPATVMERVMAAFAGIDRPPAEVLDAFLPESQAQDRLVAPLAAQIIDTGDPQAVIFTTQVQAGDPLGYEGASLTCIRFGPPTLAFAASDSTPPIGPMLLKRPADSWTGHVTEDLPELGTPQAFPEGAILRQDCLARFGVPADMPVQPLKDWPAAALQAIKGRFGGLTVTELSGAPNTRLRIRAANPQGEVAVQVHLMLGLLPYRPFDDPTLPAFGLELRAATYLFATGS